MRIGINMIILDRLGGGSKYFNNLLKRLSEIDQTNHYYVLCALETKKLIDLSDIGPNFHWVMVRMLPSIIPKRVLEQIHIPYYARKLKLDVIFQPANIGLLFSPCPVVISVRSDAPFNRTIRSMEGWRQRLRLIFLFQLSRLAINKAKTVVYLSDSSRKESVPYFNIPVSKTRVIHLGRDSFFTPYMPKENHSKNSYILYVSDFYAYKNAEILLKAFKKVKDKNTKRLPPILLAGDYCNKKYVAKLKTLIADLNLTNDVKFLGHVKKERLRELYSKCLFMVYPSLCEALPQILVEAMSCGTPLLVSTSSSMPEVCDNAAIFFNPYDENDLAEKMIHLLGDQTVRKKLSQKSLDRAKFFSWERTAKGMLKVFEEVYIS